jgi:hypothetical protein
MTEAPPSSAAHVANLPSRGHPSPRRLGGIRALGIASFTTLGFLLGAVVGGIIEGDLVGALHLGVPGAFLAFVWVSALMTEPNGR